MHLELLFEKNRILYIFLKLKQFNQKENVSSFLLPTIIYEAKVNWTVAINDSLPPAYLLLMLQHTHHKNARYL